ncbi:MAG: DeoR/GlpR family DNA-binding transcription regulator [Paracoccaceae bacterium]
MDLSERQLEILSLIRAQNRVDVDTLAARFRVTTQTIRRDLNELCIRGLAARVHGGATQPHSITNFGYEERRRFASEEKHTIGRTVAEIIPDNCSVMLNIGTTTEQVARALFGHRDLIVISNNINVINILSGSGSKELVLAGGTVRQSDGAIVGEEAVEFISRFKADYAVVGASAIDEDGAVLDFDSREVSVARAILRNARTRILVCDIQKFNRTAPLRICDISDIDIFVTDAMPEKDFAAACDAAGTKIIVAGQTDVEAVLEA